ncbi:MAG: NUDIX hydrolase [Sciscionella sp.]
MADPADPAGPLVDPADAPAWLRDLVNATRGLNHRAFSRRSTRPPEQGRAAAVLMLFSDERDVLLLRRADSLGSHPGQVAFPGGAVDARDEGPVHTALREAAEEVGVRQEAVHPLALFPELHVSVSGFLVTPVLAHWRAPGSVSPLDARETAEVARVPIDELTDPANRFRVHHPSGYVGPAFSVSGLLVWGFTAGVLSGLLELAGWDQPWNAADVRDLDSAVRAARAHREPSKAGPCRSDGAEVGA